MNGRLGLLDFPPTEPIERPWLPLQYILSTSILFPLVTATQSSWLITTLSRTLVSLVDPRSNPSLLCDAGRPFENAFGAYPALLFRVMW